jgi:hypothetical protein
VRVFLLLQIFSREIDGINKIWSEDYVTVRPLYAYKYKESDNSSSLLNLYGHKPQNVEILHRN